MASQSQNQAAPPPPSSLLFARGVVARLEIWSVLRIAVQEGWGGPGGTQKRTWIASEIVDAFETQHPVPDDQYIEELLLQILADEFETGLEDGSAEVVAQDIVRLWEETRVGKEQSMLKFEGLAAKLKGKKVEAQVVPAKEEDEWEEEDEDEEDEEMDEGDANEQAEVPRLVDSLLNPRRNEPEVDEDGFTVVKGKGRR